MNRVGEDPDKPLKEQSYDVDESELRTYDSANKKVGHRENFLFINYCSRTVRVQDKTQVIGKTAIGVLGSRGVERRHLKRNLKTNW